MKSISLKLTDSLDLQLEAAAQAQHTTKSDLVREALETYLSGHPAGRASSCLALAEDLIGCVSGPEDLSTNKEYLHGFGA